MNLNLWPLSLYINYCCLVSAKTYLYVVNIKQYKLVTVERFLLDLKTVTLVHEKTVSDDRFTL